MAVAGTTDDLPLREMAGPGPTDRLTYDLYSNAARTIVWGNSVASEWARRARAHRFSLTIYGQIPGGQNRASGTYNDTVTASVDF